ncbi:MAG: response regulator transcription factor [Bacteroidales bacterium]|nr:response regulator transcription factor [Bacteroidales bacterium]
MKILIADDNKAFREALKLYIESELGYAVIDCVEDSNKLLSSESLSQTDICLVDIEMPQLDRLSAMKKILSKHKKFKAIAITSYKEKIYLCDLISNGYKGCVFKDEIYPQLDKALLEVYNNGVYFAGDVQFGKNN